MSRIPMIESIEMSERQKEVFTDIIDGPRGRLVGPLRVVLHNPELADKWQKFGAALRYSTSVPRKLSELAILVTARRWNSDVEWYIHARDGLQAGLSEGVIESIKIAVLPEFESSEEELVYEFVRCLHETGNVPDDLYSGLVGILGTEGIMELSSIAGYYSLVSVTLNVHRVPLPVEAPAQPLPVLAENRGLTLLPKAKLK